MNKQLSLSFIHDELKEVKTHKREFLEKMDAIMPWEQLYELVSRAITKERAAISPTILS